MTSNTHVLPTGSESLPRLLFVLFSSSCVPLIVYFMSFCSFNWRFHLRCPSSLASSVSSPSSCKAVVSSNAFSHNKRQLKVSLGQILQPWVTKWKSACMTTHRDTQNVICPWASQKNRIRPLLVQLHHQTRLGKSSKKQKQMMAEDDIFKSLVLCKSSLKSWNRNKNIGCFLSLCRISWESSNGRCNNSSCVCLRMYYFSLFSLVYVSFFQVSWLRR